MDIFSYLLGKKSSGGGGGGGGSDLDWQAIGFNKRPEGIDEGYEYAKEIQNNWTPAVNLSNKFYRDFKLKFMPAVDTSNATNTSNMFYNCYSLISVAEMETSKVTNMNSMFLNCYSLTNVSFKDTSKVTDMQYMFGSCFNLKEIKYFDASNVDNLSGMCASCYNLTTFPLIRIPKIVAGTRISSMFSNSLKLSDKSLDNILQMCISATSYTGTKTLKYLGISDTTAYPVSRIEALPHYQDFLDAGWTIGY